MFALRALTPHTRQVGRLSPLASAMQQKRGMAGGDDDDDPSKVNWWDAPSKPDTWHKHHLAWVALSFWGVVFGGVAVAKSGAKPETA